MDPGKLRLRQDFSGDPAASAARAKLLCLVFDAAGDSFAGSLDVAPFAYFDDAGGCIATLEAFAMPLVCDGAPLRVGAIRQVAVHPDWRGHGLFRRLMEMALIWCDREGMTCVLLYTAEPALYHRFGFRACDQHKRVGRPPPAGSTRAATARRLRLGTPADDALLDDLLTKRTTVSHHVAVSTAFALLPSRLVQDDDWALDYIAACQAVVVSKQDDAGVFSLIDVVAPAMPSLATILRGLGRAPDGVAVLFPTDRLDWSGTPAIDDTGLMIRGTAPAAFARPFMLPPTTEF